MNDPHVISLRYELKMTEGVSFDALPVKYETDDFSLCLKNDLLTIYLKKHFSSTQRARNYIKDFLRSWEVEAGLRYGQKEIAFEYEDASIVDRAPSQPDGPSTVEISGTTSVIASGSAKLSIERGEYPDPPNLFSLSPDVETLWTRYEGYKKNREPLFSMAYFCLTLIQTRVGSRKKAAKVFNISYEVLDKLGSLSTNRGDDSTARKFTSSLKPATIEEKAWTDHAIRALIKQVGIYDGKKILKELTMSDLPELE